MYDSENRPKDIAIEEEDELYEDDKGTTKLKSEIVKAIKDMRRKKATYQSTTYDNIPETTTYQSTCSRNWGTMG